VAEKLAYVGRQTHVKSPVRYLTAAIRDGFGAAPVATAPVAETLVQDAETGAEAAAQAARDAMISEERRQRGARMTRVRTAAAARTPTQRDADKRLFLSAVKDPLEREDFGRFGWSSALNATAIFAFWEDLQPGLFDGVQAGHAVVAKGMDFAHRDALGLRRPRLMFGPVKATQP